MKKSKIIVPALAMIGLSAVASITGSVAWFTAQRTATVNAGTYAVVKTNADLACVVDGGAGTTASNNTVTVKDDYLLTDASFDHTSATTPEVKNPILYYPNAYGTAVGGTVAFSNILNESSLERDAAAHVYSAFSFTLAFTVTFGGTGNDMGLFLDNSAGGQTSFTTSGTAITATGFRMAFVGTGTNAASTKTRVLADLQTSGNCKYVDSAEHFAPASAASYSEDELIHSTYTTAMPEDKDKTYDQVKDRPDFLGKFTFSANGTYVLNYTVVCWFEGTDPNIVNQDAAEKYQSVVAKLDFKAIPLKA